MKNVVSRSVSATLFGALVSFAQSPYVLSTRRQVWTTTDSGHHDGYRLLSCQFNWRADWFVENGQYGLIVDLFCQALALNRHRITSPRGPIVFMYAS